MGTNTFQTKNAGDVIASSDPNQYKTGLDIDHVPRTSGAPTDLAGGLGSTLYRWASSYINKIFLGVAAREVAIEESGTAFLVTIGGTTKMKVGTAGIDGTYAAPGTFLLSSFLSTERPIIRSTTYDADATITVPTGVTELFVEGCGGGGGGGGGGTGVGTGGGGGGGGGGSAPSWGRFAVTPGESLVIDIGAAGAAGAAANPGGAGGETNIQRSGTKLFAVEGAPGGAAGATGNPGAGGAGGSAGWRARGGVVSGGAGGAGNVAGAGGDPSHYDTGGGGGTTASSGDGGGGGGGAGYGTGGGGGNGGSANGASGTAPGAGGGGGGGSAGSGAGGAGAAGISGRLIIFWVGATT